MTIHPGPTEIVGFVAALGLLAYLAVALLFPERFS